MVIYDYFWNPNTAHYYKQVLKLFKFKKEFNYVFITKIHHYNGVGAIDYWPEIREKLIQENKKVIVFVADDEYYTLGDEYIIPDITIKIFKNYGNLEHKDHPIIRPLPLPNNNTFNRVFDWKEKVFDYSFLGTLMPERIPLRAALQQREADQFLKFIKFNEEGEIVNPRYYEQYANILNSTKISLCPPGWRNNECYRTIDSAEVGSIILTSTLIDHWYNKSAPYIKVDDWSDMSVLDTVLNRSFRELEDISYETKKWYEDCLSPKAIADFITREVKG